MASFASTHRMDYNTMADLAEVRSKPGLHYDFELGIKIKKASKTFHWPQPIYNGCAVRAFYFSGENPSGQVEVKYNYRYYVAPAINNGHFKTIYKNGGLYEQTHVPKEGYHVEKNTYFSIGVIVEGKYLASLFGKQKTSSHDMDAVVGYNWDISIKEGPMFLTSFHIYDELGRNFPSPGLGNGYVHVQTWRVFQTPIGSSVTVELVYTGNPNESVTVQLEENGPVATYSSVPLNTNDVFTVVVENTIKGWDVSVSFEGPNQDSRLVRRQEVDYHTRPTFSKNCSVTRILAVCAPLTAHHRE